MEFFSNEHIQIERLWCDERTGTKLVVRHLLSGMTAERVIGFDDESRHRSELLHELSHRFSTRYPAQDFIMEHACGAGKGASLRLLHVSSGISVDRVVGYESVPRHQREMMAELFQKLRERDDGSN
jgi:hypothetical protein